MKRASYREGVAWIAGNDDPATLDHETISLTFTVGLLADLFDTTPDRVTTDVIRYRKRKP